MSKNIDLDALSEDELLNLKICDLPLTIEGTWLKVQVEGLYSELAAKGINFKPECYLADEWLAPDKEPTVGVPFYLAHPRLMKLENKMMQEVEGGTKEWCSQLLRHEAGHAINYAYRLYRKKKWQKVFGQFSTDYPDTYKFRPYSKSFVRHLENYYAQYHPDEDFAETFAVWLTPKLDWQYKYHGWKALDKLLCVDRLMQQIKGLSPTVKKATKHWQASKIRITLKNFYKKRQCQSAEDFPDFHDANLKRLFSTHGHSEVPKITLTAFIKKYRRDILNQVSIWTGEKKYLVDSLLKTLTERGKALGIHLEGNSVEAIKVSVYVTALVMHYRYTGTFRGEK